MARDIVFRERGFHYSAEAKKLLLRRSRAAKRDFERQVKSLPNNPELDKLLKRIKSKVSHG